MYRYVLFDLDGTLTDPKEGICKSVQYALHHMGIEEPEIDKLEPFIGPPLIDSFCTFYGMDELAAKKAVEYYRERFSVTGLYENEVYPGIRELLAEGKNAGGYLAVASSKPEIYVRRILDHFELTPYFTVIVGSLMDGSRMQKEEVVEEALRQLQQAGCEKMTRDNTAMVGDRRFDVEGAKANHLCAVGVTYGYAQEGELEKAGADYLAHSVTQLKDWLWKDGNQ